MARDIPVSTGGMKNGQKYTGLHRGLKDGMRYAGLLGVLEKGIAVGNYLYAVHAAP